LHWKRWYSSDTPEPTSLITLEGILDDMVTPKSSGLAPGDRKMTAALFDFLLSLTQAATKFPELPPEKQLSTPH
jgi:hypothetical protein